MKTSLKAGFAQIFSCCPKNLSCPKFGGAAAPLAPPARTPMGVTIFPEPGKNKSTRRPPNDDSACHENRGFWDNGDQTKASFIGITHQRKNLLKEAISSQCEAGAVRALDRARRVLPAVNSTNVRRGIPIIFWRVRERS